MKRFHSSVFIGLTVVVFFSTCMKKELSVGNLFMKPGFKKLSLLILFDSKIQKLVCTDEGVIRGVDFDTNLEDLRKAESQNNISEIKNGLLVRVDLGEGASAEVTFYKREGELIGHISSDIYLKDNLSAQKFMDRYSAYLDIKYGTRTDHSDGIVTWEIPGGHHISLKRFDEGEEPGLEMESF